MRTEEINVEIKGISPLLMHGFPLEDGGNMPKGFEKWPAARQAEYAAYRDPDTRELFMPSEAIRLAMISAAKWTKGKGRASMKADITAVLNVAPARLLLGTQEYALDIRSVVNPSTKGRVLRSRPRLDEWTLSLRLSYDPILMTPATLREILDNAGQRIGIGDFRRETKGTFGCFEVARWEPVSS